MVLQELPEAPISVLIFGFEYRDTFVFRAGIGTANINDAKDDFWFFEEDEAERSFVPVPWEELNLGFAF
jgi:hypothetical protein